MKGTITLPPDPTWREGPLRTSGAEGRTLQGGCHFQEAHSWAKRGWRRGWALGRAESSRDGVRRAVQSWERRRRQRAWSARGSVGKTRSPATDLPRHPRSRPPGPASRLHHCSGHGCPPREAGGRPPRSPVALRSSEWHIRAGRPASPPTPPHTPTQLTARAPLQLWRRVPCPLTGGCLAGAPALPLGIQPPADAPGKQL